MKQIKSFDMEVGKVIGELTKDYLEKGLVLTRFETGGINSFTKIMVFSSSETTTKQVIFVRTIDTYRWVDEGIRFYRVYTSTVSEEKADSGFIDVIFEESEKEEVAQIIVLTNRGKQFSLSEDEYEDVIAKRKARRRLAHGSITFREFQVDNLKTIKGFKRQPSTVKRLRANKLSYEIIGSEKGSKKVSI